VAGAAAVAGAIVLLSAPPAWAEPYLTAEDATELVQILTEAAEQQDVCYGWAVQLDDHSGGPSGLDAGSGQGVGQLASKSGCRRWVELRGQVLWTSETSDQEDSSEFEVIAQGLVDPPTADDLHALGIDSTALARDDGDVALYEAMLALPRLVADSGEAPAPELEPADATPPAGAMPTGGPVLPDWWRQRWPAVVVGGALIALAGAIVLAYRSGAGRPAARPRPRTPTQPQTEPQTQPRTGPAPAPPAAHPAQRPEPPLDPPSEGAS
jgi:hypothetical protein